MKAEFDPELDLVVERVIRAPRARRLFEHPGDATGLKLTGHEATPSGLLLLEYETVGAATVGEYEGVSAFV